ncbi:N-acetyltransferase [Streptomyces sp. GbtcB6]|uniref:GNAT family N-acetyltransferase n=1 Tax=Streptomyces sp. GbtcB6 TaxID=2824751 RepID=UPI001C2F9FF0|nr:GNAT family N-acetyltransferase [Streptomyces sp. GbtcB6]
MSVEVAVVREADDESVEALARLLPQLPSTASPLDRGAVGTHIEDVVVDEAARGHGVGGALAEEALRLAEAAGARTVDLTSRPSRQAANRLYGRLGFEARDSRVYRFVLQR